MKNFKYVFYRLLKIIPPSKVFVKIIDYIIKILVVFKKNGALLYKYFDIKLLEKSSSRWIESYDIITDDELEKYRYKKITESGYVDVPFAPVNSFSKGGKISVWQNNVNLFKIDNAKVEPFSDIIKIANKAIWFKANKKTISKELPCDVNMIHYDMEVRKVFTIKRFEIVYVDQAFSLFGVHISAWAHFIVEFLPKIIILNNLNYVNNLVLLAPDGLDEHIKFLIEDNLVSSNIKILYVDPNTEVNCNCLYFCSPLAYICNNATYTHVTDIVIPNYTREIIAAVFNKYKPEVIRPCKVYIGRLGGRNLTNHKDVELLFKASGYSVVYPHLLSWQEKVDIFGNATHVVGPASSGFMNVLFCHKKTKVLSFINFERCFDPIFSQLIEYYPDLKFWYILGDLVGRQGINSSYKINLEELSRFLIDTDFDKNLLDNIEIFKSCNQ
jgi:capsular polysaccharide biosynthesis protein